MAIKIALKEEVKYYDTIISYFDKKARLHIKLKEYKNAIIDYKKILDLQKVAIKEVYRPCEADENEFNPARELQLIELCMYLLEDYEDAINYFTKSLGSINSFFLNQICLVLRGQSYVRLGKSSEAKQDWDKVGKINPNYSDRDIVESYLKDLEKRNSNLLEALEEAYLNTYGLTMAELII